MDNSLKNIFAIPELRNRVLFTLGLLGVYRVGHHIPTPGVNTSAPTAPSALRIEVRFFLLRPPITVSKFPSRSSSRGSLDAR